MSDFDAIPKHAGPLPVKKKKSRARRYAVVALSVLAVALWTASVWAPWWQFWLYAPQYPNGLRLDIALTGLAGDAKEISMLNHYIGMKSLEDAAVLERQFALWGVGLVALLSVGLTLMVGKRWNWLILLPAVGLPLGFVVDSMAWLYHFGHSLDRHAPLNIPEFTPQFFGWGQIGQFTTYAMPLTGFWLALGATGLMLWAVLWRRRICKTCPLLAQCGTTCNHALVGPGVPK